ncbi:MAG: hypothetical protein AB7N76_28630 [Planctomycetota bacterium]
MIPTTLACIALRSGDLSNLLFAWGESLLHLVGPAVLQLLSLLALGLALAGVAAFALAVFERVSLRRRPALGIEGRLPAPTQQPTARQPQPARARVRVARPARAPKQKVSLRAPEGPAR